MRTSRNWWWMGLAALAPTVAGGAEPIDYLRDIQPLLKARCFACHGALQQKANLRVDTVASLVRGGDSGPAVAAGESTGPLLERITASDADTRMPPEGKPLTAEEIERIRAWIAQGAKAPEKETPEADPRDHWSFQPPVRAAVPNNAAHPVDAFLLARLEQQKLTTRPAAKREAQLRRLYLDLIGLPPTREELQAFLADQSPQAWETVVDRLLDDPRHGERWARHWMDIWRYSDWYGRRQESDVRNSASQIWRWRDWIVKSINQDHGYDRMLQEMLAADELRPDDDEAAVATGYLIRNFYSLNQNDWMRNIVEHTGKAFLGLTFNCAHCHDHKYDPITQENYFQLRAVFEPIYIRQDRVAGEGDPGKFQDYDYGGMRKVQRLGLVRIFDKSPDAPTWFYTGGDERNRVKDRGSITPGVPAFLANAAFQIEPRALPPLAWYPGLRPGIQETILADAQAGVTRAANELQVAQAAGTEPTPEAVAALRAAEAAFDSAKQEAAAANQPGALSGAQSLVLDAVNGRRTVQNGLPQLKELPDGAALEFQLQVIQDAHVNFQLAKDVVKGLTAGYVAWDRGKILSYQPGSFTEFPVGQYDFAGGQRRFHVRLQFDLKGDRCLLTVRCLNDEKLLVDQAAIALNGWNPVGDPVKAISFDARTGSTAVVDDVILSAPATANAAVNRLMVCDFEPPAYANNGDLAGISGWVISQFSVAPATSTVSNSALNSALRDASQKLDSARRVTELPTLRLKAAQVRLTAAETEQAGIAARLAADRAKFGENSAEVISAAVRAASRAEREAAVRQREADVLAQDVALSQAEAKPADDANRGKEIEAAVGKLAAARQALQQAHDALSNEALAETYTAFSPTYPQTSTGRRTALARWITDRRNPLTARVAVNHLWSHHFHAPLVTSVYDLGRNGASPTHPELLDWLAVELMENGWSMKHLHRLIVTSESYRRASSIGDAARNVELDPENKLLWRMNVGRMEAEVVRDSLLFCANRLELTQGGQELEPNLALTTFRRSLYYSIHPEGGGKGPLGELFDAPDPLDCYRRTRSIIPQQALALTNSDLIHQLSAAIVAEKKEASLDADVLVTELFERILSRAPTAQELQICRESLAVPDAAELTKARESLTRALFNHNDFITIR